MNHFFRQKFNRISFTILFLGLLACQKAAKPNPEAAAIAWLTSLEAAQAKALSAKKPVLLDFWAEWCGPCKELEATTYKDAQVLEIISQKTIPTQLDFTDMGEDKKKILLKYSIFGLPSVIFLDARGRRIPQGDLSGYFTATDFLDAYARVKKATDAEGVCGTC